MKILCLMDSPLLRTGFAKVGRYLATEWAKHGATVDIWAIGFTGWGYADWPHGKLFPAGVNWTEPRQLNTFLALVEHYSHVFLLQDPFQFTAEFCEAFRRQCRRRRSLMYFPVDAPMEPGWTDILQSVDVAVAYTNYGAAEARRASGGQLSCRVLPHGVDGAIFRSRPKDRQRDREMWRVDGRQFVGEGDWLLVNVNANQRRKDPGASLILLSRLRAMDVPAKLVMHCRGATPYGVDLDAVSRQLGLRHGVDWIHTGHLFGIGDTTFLGFTEAGSAVIGSAVTDSDVARFYNGADCLLSTSLGEGWGLSVTEALACGCPVAVPEHTSLREIAQHAEFSGRSVLLPVQPVAISGEMSRLRFAVRVQEAASALADFYRSRTWVSRPPLSHTAQEWLSWPRIAKEMLTWLEG